MIANEKAFLQSYEETPGPSEASSRTQSTPFLVNKDAASGEKRLPLYLDENHVGSSFLISINFLSDKEIQGLKDKFEKECNLEVVENCFPERAKSLSSSFHQKVCIE